MSENPTEELTAISHRLLEAIRDRDRGVLEGILDESFVHVSVDDLRQTRPEFVGALTRAEYVIDAIGFDRLRVECRGATGVVVGVQRARGHLPDGTAFVSRSAFTDVFRRADDGWRVWLAYSVELPEPTTP